MSKQSDRRDSKGRKKKIRTTDDLDLLKQILEENPLLKMRVMRLIENTLGLEQSNESRRQRYS